MKRLVFLLPVLLAFQVGVQPALAWTWPVDGPVLRPFVFGDDPYAAGQHRGVDIGAPSGASVRAPAGGTVSFAGTVPTGGRTITIRTPDGYSVTLLHLGGIGVTRGASVAEGAAVGTIGSSGQPGLAEPHVHLGIRLTTDANGYLDPLTLLPPRSGPAPEPEPNPAAAPDPAPAPAADEPPASAPHPEPVSGPAPAQHETPAPAAARARGKARRADVPARPALQVHSRSEGTARIRGAEPTSPQGSHGPSLLLARERLWDAGAAMGPTARAASHAPGRDGGAWPWGSLFAGLAAAAVAGLFLRRQLGDAGAAHRPPSMLLEVAAVPAEDAGGVGLGEKDGLVLDRDLERILFAETEALPNLDRNHDAPQLVEVPNDARRHSPGRACRRSRRLSRRHGLRGWCPSVRVHA
jgi:hypothetical protein